MRTKDVYPSPSGRGRLRAAVRAVALAQSGEGYGGDVRTRQPLTLSRKNDAEASCAQALSRREREAKGEI